MKSELTTLKENIMNDGNGAIAVTKSEKFVGDMDAICKSMNQIECFSTGHPKFVMDKDNIWCMEELHCPTASPQCPEKFHFRSEDGTETWKSPDEMSEEDYHTYCLIDLAPMPLKELSAHISQHISDGSLIISSCFSEDAHTVSFEELTIEANGDSRRISSWRCVGDTGNCNREEYIAQQLDDEIPQSLVALAT